MRAILYTNYILRLIVTKNVWWGKRMVIIRHMLEGAKKRCQQCVALSGNFSYYFRRFDKQKIIETIDEFTKHWNEQHRDVIISNT